MTHEFYINGQRARLVRHKRMFNDDLVGVQVYKEASRHVPHLWSGGWVDLLAGDLEALQADITLTAPPNQSSGGWRQFKPRD